MALETASYVANLVTSNPDGNDQRSTADDHLRLIKAVLRRTFPNLDGAVSLSAAQIMYSNDLSASVQLQLNQLRDGSATANNALVARYANSASLALYANSASYATFCASANSASYAVLAGTATLALTANSASYAALAGNAAYATTAGTANSATTALSAASATSALTAGSATTANSATTATTAATATNALALNSQTAATAATPSTIAARDGSGYLFAAYFNQSSTQESGTPDNVFVTVADNYLRKVAPATLGATMDARNITSRTGTAKTLSTSAPSGGSNGDIWYKY